MVAKCVSSQREQNICEQRAEGRDTARQPRDPLLGGTPKMADSELLVKDNIFRQRYKQDWNSGAYTSAKAQRAPFILTHIHQPPTSGDYVNVEEGEKTFLDPSLSQDLHRKLTRSIPDRYPSSIQVDICSVVFV